MALDILIKELKEHENIIVLKEEILKLDPIDDGLIKEFPYLNDYRDDLLYLNNTHVLWNYKNENGEEKPGGEFHLRSLNEVLRNYLNLEFINIKLPNFLVFEDHPNAGDGLLIGFTYNENQQMELWLYDNGIVYPINLNLRQYFEELAKRRGLYNWQYLFVEPKLLSNHNSYMSGQLQSIKDLHTKLFDELLNV